MIVIAADGYCVCNASGLLGCVVASPLSRMASRVCGLVELGSGRPTIDYAAKMLHKIPMQCIISQIPRSHNLNYSADSCANQEGKTTANATPPKKALGAGSRSLPAQALFHPHCYPKEIRDVTWESVPTPCRGGPLPVLRDEGWPPQIENESSLLCSSVSLSWHRWARGFSPTGERRPKGQHFTPIGTSRTCSGRVYLGRKLSQMSCDATRLQDPFSRI